MDCLIANTIKELEEQGRFKEERKIRHHGYKTVFYHSVKVAELSLKIALVIPLKFNYNYLVRGALLHDYFLYDWHKKKMSGGLHGYTHAREALKNANNDYNLTKIEKDIIVKHMFPLNIKPPKYRESWVVCIADKICAANDYLKRTVDSSGRKINLLQREVI